MFLRTINFLSLIFNILIMDDDIPDLEDFSE